MVHTLTYALNDVALTWRRSPVRSWVGPFPSISEEIKMVYEIEVKLWYKNKDKIKSILTKLGARFDKKIIITDTYFDNKNKPFDILDEVLRIRKIGKHIELTHKGKSKTNHSIRCREEISIPITNHKKFVRLLEALGFIIIAEVIDNREIWRLNDIEIDFISKSSKKVPESNYLEIEGPSKKKVSEIIEKLKPHAWIITQEEIAKFRFLAGITKED